MCREGRVGRLRHETLRGEGAVHSHVDKNPPPQPRPPTWGEYQWNPCLAGGSGALPVAAGRKHVARRLLSRGQRTRQEVLQCYYNLKRKKKEEEKKKKPWWFLALNPNLHLIWESFA